VQVILLQGGRCKIMEGSIRIEEHYFTETEKRVLEYDGMSATLPEVHGSAQG